MAVWDAVSKVAGVSGWAGKGGTVIGRFTSYW